MTPNKDIFCNSPWYELQIYWDGSYGFCCSEAHKTYPDSQRQRYNVRNMSISEWFDSEPMRQARLSMFGSQKNSICQQCYHEEDYSNTSRRHKCNQKSVIFTRTNFSESYLQSPGFDKFEHSRTQAGAFNQLPIDLHIDLGNHCNLACKHCIPMASSTVASQYVKWGIQSANQYIGADWTRDDQVWNKILTEIANIPNLKNVHFMGGETLISRRFEDFLDFMIERKKFDLNFSFVSNGTIFDENLLNKLKKFQRVGIEISIETTTDHNAYQRQGTNTEAVLSNIKQYRDHSDRSDITVTLRPTITTLTVGYYTTLLRYCMENNLVVKCLIVHDHDHLDTRILPEQVKKQYIEKYKKLLDEYDLHSVDTSADFNESDSHQLRRIIKNQIDQCIALLSSPRPDNSDELMTEMVKKCRQWDDIYKYNALELYPELRDEFINRGY